MALTSGTRLGVYDITAQIGEGGMGQVWRGTDTTLGRQVAIKILPDAFAADPERLARFEREAKTLASLNHPHIAAIYGFEKSSGMHALVMELVEGEDLSQRIAKGAIPIDEALPIAKQIAEALEAAHEQGIVHRDLKPANVKVRPDGTVKVLDFGLAKAMDQGSGIGDPFDFAQGRQGSAHLANSPTITTPAHLRQGYGGQAMTQAGMILGTAAYMAPEQASGKAVDKRADVWSFGVVLLEMLTGQRLFDGETVSHTLADVLRGPIDFSRLPVDTPGAIRDLLRRCLNRDVKKRTRDIGEARIAIDEALTTPASVDTVGSRVPDPGSRVKSRNTMFPWAVAGGALIVAGVLLMLWAPWRSATPVDRPLMRLNASLGPDALASAISPVAISPDGTRIVFPIRGADGKALLATRLLDQSAITPLPGTDNGFAPFFSPDGQSIGFVADNKLKKVVLRAGAPVALADVSVFGGASWGENGDIVTSLLVLGGLQRIPAAGGAPQAVTILGPQEALHLWPQVLPGGNAVLFTASQATASFQDANIQVVSLPTSPGKTGEVKTLVSNGHAGRYLATNGSAGHLVFLRQGVLYAVAFDPVRLEVRGVPEPILEDVAGATGGTGNPFDVSRNGTFVYHPGRATDRTWPIVWMDSSSKTEPLVSTPGNYSSPRFSPDGQRLALSVDMGKGLEIFIFDRQRDALSRLTFTGAFHRGPVWSRDGAHLVFTSYDSAGGHVHWTRADGSGDTQVLLEGKNRIVSHGLSPDGKLLAYYDIKPDGDSDLWTLPLEIGDPERPKPGKPAPFLQTPASEAGPVFSPDGRYVAYFSNESGAYEVYVRPAPGPDGKPGPGKWQVSTAGGIYPQWSSNGRELFFFRSSDSRIMVTDYTATGDSFSSTKVRVWSDRQVRTVGSYLSNALAPDGKRVAVFPLPEATAEDKGAAHVTFLLNFFDEVRRKVPSVK